MATTTLHLQDTTIFVDAVANLHGADGRHKIGAVDGLTAFAVVRAGKVRSYEAVDAKGDKVPLTFVKVLKPAAGVAAAAGEWQCQMCHTHKDGSRHCFPIDCPED
jgi:hypothetical protein